LKDRKQEQRSDFELRPQVARRPEVFRRPKANLDVARHSPCIGICKLDDATGYCLGCGRTGSEVGDWIAMSESQRDRVWADLPARLAALSVSVRLLPLTRDELVDWIGAGIEAGGGTWVVGTPGAVAEFPPASDVSIDVGPGGLTARSSGASLRVVVNEKVRAFALAEGGPIVLGLPRGRAGIRSAFQLQPLGPDAAAIDEAQRADALFDIGIGRRYMRFCVRTGDEALASALSAQSGRHWSEALPIIKDQLISVGPHRIVESAGARIEVFAGIPTPGEPPPAGAHTHFLPEFLKSDEEIAAGLALPDYAAPIAIFYPKIP
jgi:predicted Fe-S protein YdhL (DUF1289 family)